MSRVVIGMGNTFRRDDGVGAEVARRLRRLAPNGVTILELDGEPASLLDAWEGADVAYVVDSVRGNNPGAVHHVQLSANNAIPAGHEQGSTHTLGLGEAVELARVLDRLPPTLTIIGIEGVDFSTGEGLSQEVGRAAAMVADDLAQRLATAARPTAKETKGEKMMSANLLVDAFGRVSAIVHRVVEGLSSEQLSFRVDDQTNSIAWLVWHLTRIQDDHIADVAGTEQVYTSGGWADRFALPFNNASTGYGHSSDDVAAVIVESGELLTGYHDAVLQQTLRFVEPLNDDDFARIVDEAWDPPVSLGVRVVSVISDNLQHAGQAAFVRGIIERT